MIKFNHLWYLLHICCDFAILVNPFFRAVTTAAAATTATTTTTTFHSKDPNR